jgi:hypothetical protein
MRESLRPRIPFNLEGYRFAFAFHPGRASQGHWRRSFVERANVNPLTSSRANQLRLDIGGRMSQWPRSGWCGLKAYEYSLKGNREADRWPHLG